MTTGALSMGSDIGRCSGDHVVEGSKISPNYILTQVFSAGHAKMASMLAFFYRQKQDSKTYKYNKIQPQQSLTKQDLQLPTAAYNSTVL